MKGIILCGGEGAKMWPYNKYWQKCCIPVGNTPNILRIVRQMKKAGITDIHVFTGYMDTQVRHSLRQEQNLNIQTVANEKLGAAISAIGDDAVIYYGDIYAGDEALGQLMQGFKKGGNAVLLTPLTDGRQAADYICASEQAGQIHSFYGHPREHYVNAKVGGVFVLSAETLRCTLYNPGTFTNVPVGGMPPKAYFLEQSLQTALEDGHCFQGIYCAGTCIDMDFPWDIMNANQAYCGEKGSKMETTLGNNATISSHAAIGGNVILGDNSVIGDRVVIEGNCIIGSNTVIENGAIIGANTVIGDYCNIRDYCRIASHTVIGNRNKIGFSAEVTGVTFDQVSIVHTSEVYGVVGKNTDIAAGCVMGIMRFDDSDSVQRAPVKKYAGKNLNGVFIGDYSRTGIGNLFLPGVKIGANTALGPGLIIDRDIEEHKLVLVKQETIERDWQYNRYGW